MEASEKRRYTQEELALFERSILRKLDQANTELRSVLEALGRTKENSVDNNLKMLEDSAEVSEKENLSQLAARQRKFISELEASLVRIKNGTYGICVITGELIDKERLQAVPHTRHSLAAKLAHS